MDIFKLIFEHDIVFDDYSGKEDTHKEKSTRTTLEQFMKPMPTYVKYYFTGTRLGDPNCFGLSALDRFSELADALQTVFKDEKFIAPEGVPDMTLSERLLQAEPHEVFLIGDGAASRDISALQMDERTGVREKLRTVVPLLDQGIRFLATEKAHHGIDLHLFAKDNHYEAFFNAFQPLTSLEDLRYFSINGKRVGSERSFYFETWTLNRPPHGFEEVTESAVLR